MSGTVGCDFNSDAISERVRFDDNVSFIDERGGVINTTDSSGSLEVQHQHKVGCYKYQLRGVASPFRRCFSMFFFLNFHCITDIRTSLRKDLLYHVTSASSSFHLQPSKLDALSVSLPEETAEELAQVISPKATDHKEGFKEEV